MRYENFCIGNVFLKVETKKIKGKANDFPTIPTKEYVIPLLTASVDNQGLSRYAKRNQCITILSNVLSISANGNAGVVFYQPKEFAVLQDAYAIKVKNYDIPNIEIGIFLATTLHKAISSIYNWSYKASWNRVKMNLFSLPIMLNNNNEPIIDKSKGYHELGYIPNFKEMYLCIVDIKKEQISKIEQHLNTLKLEKDFIK